MAIYNCSVCDNWLDDDRFPMVMNPIKPMEGCCEECEAEILEGMKMHDNPAWDMKEADYL